MGIKSQPSFQWTAIAACCVAFLLSSPSLADDLELLQRTPATVQTDVIENLATTDVATDADAIFDAGVLSGAESSATTVDDFESVEPSWKIVRSGDLARVLSHRRTDVSPREGRRSEFLSVVGARGGERILATHSLPTSAVIEELQIHAWIRGDRPGFQLMGRVRLPRTLDEDGKPLAFQVFGETYSAKGLWQQLSLTNIESKSKDAVRALRIELGKHVDARGAYVDQVSLNLFGGAGRNQIFIDELAVEASFPVSTTAKPRAFAGDTRAATSASGTTSQFDHKFQLANFAMPLARSTTAQITSRIQAGNWVPRAITYHGESFATLKEIGFNTIWLEEPATLEQIANARKLNLWLVSPPLTDQSVVEEADRVIAWAVDLEGLDPTTVLNRVRALKTRDPMRRPTIALRRGGGEETWSRLVDVIVDRSNATHSISQSASGFHANSSRTRWVSLGQPLVAASRWLPLRKQVWNSVVKCYDGFLLHTTESIEPVRERHTRNLAELFNLELRMLQPWVLNSSAEHVSNMVAASPYQVDLLSNNHTSLLFVTPRTTLGSKRNSVPRQNDIEIPTSNHRDVFRVEPGGLSPVAGRRVAGGIRISLNPSKPDGILMLTDRASIITSLSRHLRSSGDQTIELLEEVLRTELVQLDRRLEHSVSDPTYRSHLRKEVHQLHGRIAWLLDAKATQTDRINGAKAVSFRELDHVLGQLERVHRQIEVRGDRVVVQ